MATVARAVLVAVAIASAMAPRRAAAQSTDPLEGLPVSAVRVTGLRNLSSDQVERHLATRVGEPFHRTTMALDQRRLDELRLFTTVVLEPQQENQHVILNVKVSETLRLLPVVIIRVTDENGVSVGPGVRGINLFGGGMQLGAAIRFGGETSGSVTLDGTTVTPGTWSTHLGFSDTSRRNELYEFDEHATTVEARIGRNFRRGLRAGVMADFLGIDSGPSGPSLSPDGVDVIPTVGMFMSVDTLDTSTNPRKGTWAEVEVDRLFGDASSWTFILDGRRFQPLSARHGLGLFGLATFQTGEPGIHLPEYLRFALGGANSVRGWDIGSRRGRNQFISTVEYSYVVETRHGLLRGWPELVCRAASRGVRGPGTRLGRRPELR